MKYLPMKYLLLKYLLALLFSSTLFSQTIRTNLDVGFMWQPAAGYQIITQWDNSLYHPYTESYLYFDGKVRGAFVRHLGSTVAQYNLSIPAATKDTVDITWRMFNDGVTGGTVMGKAGALYVGVGVNAGAWFVEVFLYGGWVTIDTVLADVAWHTYRVKYIKATTNIEAWVDGVQTVNQDYTSTSTVVSTHSLCFGYGDALNNVSDSTQAPTGTGWKGGISAFQLKTYSGGIDTTDTGVWTGAGDNLYFLRTSGGNYVSGLIDYERADYTDVLPLSPHMELGQTSGRDVRNPTWINTGTPPTFIDTVSGGVWKWTSAVDEPNTDWYTETYTNAEAPYVTNFTGQAESTYAVVGGVFNTCNVTNLRVRGDSLEKIGKYNIVTKKWSPFKNSQRPNNNVISVCQWDSSLVAAGLMTAFTGIARTRGVARWDGTNWNELDSGFNNDAVCVEVVDDTLYAGGNFTASGGTTINSIARLINGVWQPMGTGMNGYVYNIIKYKGYIYAGGTYNTAGGLTANGLARWNGTAWEVFGTGLKNNAGGAGVLYSFAIYNDELYGGGTFDSVQGMSCKNLFKYNGTTFTAVGTSDVTRGSQGGGVVNMQVDSTYNQLWIAGQWSKFNGAVSYNWIVYNGSTFTPLPFTDMRYEGAIITGNSTAGIRYFFMGDQYSVYGVTLQAMFEFTPTFN